MRPDGGTNPRRLRKLRVRRVDLVPAGANPESHVTLAKASAPPAPPVRKEDTMTLAENIATLSEDEQSAVEQYVTDLAAELEAERGRSAAAAEALAKAQASDDEDPDEAVLKGLDPQVADLVRKARTEAAEAKAEAAAVTKAERTRTFKARAGSLVNLSGGPDGDGAERLGEVLEKAEATLDADTYAELERTLIAADTQVTTATDQLTKAIGSDEGATADADVRAVVKARADALVAEGADPVTALRKARAENAEAVAEAAAKTASGTR